MTLIETTPVHGGAIELYELSREEVIRNRRATRRAMVRELFMRLLGWRQ